MFTIFACLCVQHVRCKHCGCVVYLLEQLTLCNVKGKLMRNSIRNIHMQWLCVSMADYDRLH